MRCGTAWWGRTASGGAHDLRTLPSRHGGAATHDARFDLRVREVARVETDYPRRGEPADGGGRSIRNRKSMSGNVRKVALKALCICGE